MPVQESVQLTVIAIISDGAHLLINNGGAPWDVFRLEVSKTVLDYLAMSKAIGVHVECAVIAHGDHFHEICSQKQFFEVMAANPAQRAATLLREDGGTCH